PNQGFAFDAGARRLIFVVTSQTNISRLSAVTEAAGRAKTNVTALALYDARTFAPIGQPMVLPGTIPFLSSVSPGGRELATGTINPPTGLAALWDIDPTHWMKTACRLAHRNLTRAEWAQYLPGRRYQ